MMHDAASEHTLHACHYLRDASLLRVTGGGHNNNNNNKWPLEGNEQKKKKKIRPRLRGTAAEV